MAAAVLQFRSFVGSEVRRILTEIENAHGRDVLSMHYNKLSRLVQICTEASSTLTSQGRSWSCVCWTPLILLCANSR